MAKVVYFVRRDGNGTGGRLLFNRFETEDMQSCIEFIKQILSDHHGDDKTKITCKATGGGAFKFAHMLEELGIVVEKEDEMVCCSINVLTSRNV